MSAADHLSAGQLSDLAKQMNNPEQGGFTVDYAGPGVSEPPRSSGGLFLVGVKKHGDDAIPAPITAESIGEFVSDPARQKALAQHEKYALGGWQDPFGTASLDVVRKVPAPGGIDRAVRMSYGQDQYSFGVLDPVGDYQEEIRTVHPQQSRQPIIIDPGQITSPDYRVLNPPTGSPLLSLEEHNAPRQAHKYRAVAARQAGGYSNENLAAAQALQKRMAERAAGMEQRIVPPGISDFPVGANSGRLSGEPDPPEARDISAVLRTFR